MSKGSRQWPGRAASVIASLIAMGLFTVLLYFSVLGLAESSGVYRIAGIGLVIIVLAVALARIMKKWKTTLAGLLLASLGLVHAIWPDRLSLDWPAVTMLISGVLLCFSGRLVALLPYVKRLKLGEAEIELQEKLSDLRENVEKLEERAQTDKRSLGVHVAPVPDPAIESAILDLATKDKAAALLRLGMEIEKELVRLCRDACITPPRSWRESVLALTKAKILDPFLARAIIDFRDVRNQVIHSGLRGPVQQTMLTRTIDDGLKLLRHLELIVP